MHLTRTALIALAASVPALAGGLQVLKATPDDTLGARATTAPLALVAGQQAGRFTLMNTDSGQVVRSISLRGRWDFDAISPDGKQLYFIQHGIGGNPNHYAVRLFVVQKGHLTPGRVVDKREIESAMTGVAASRAMGPGNRWAYTLYRRTNGEMFIHALDTPYAFAVCIDIPKRITSAAGLRLTADNSGKQLRLVSSTGREVARVAVRQDFRGSFDDFHVLR